MAKPTPKKTSRTNAPKPAAKKKNPAPGKASKTAVATSEPITKKSERNANGAAPGKLRNPAAPTPAIFAFPIATPGKPVKNQAGLKTRELEVFRELLLAKRRELLGDVDSMEQEALRSATGSNLSNLPIHMADMGTDNYEQEFTLGLVEKDRQLLREINVALGKIRDGTYGICEGTGKPITKARLDAKPWARYSIEHMRKMEKGLLRG